MDRGNVLFRKAVVDGMMGGISSIWKPYCYNKKISKG